MLNPRTNTPVSVINDVGQFGEASWSLWIDGKLFNCRVTPIDTASGEVSFINAEHGYDLPYIFSRVVGDTVVWFSNPLLSDLWPFDDENPIRTFDVEAYFASFPKDNTGLPPLGRGSDFVRYCETVVSRLPPPREAEYCIPEYQSDESGRQLMKKFDEALRSEELAVPDLAVGRELTMARMQFEVGFSTRETVVIDVSKVSGTEWFRLIEPDVFPIWISQSTDINPVSSKPAKNRKRR